MGGIYMLREREAYADDFATQSGLLPPGNAIPGRETHKHRNIASSDRLDCARAEELACTGVARYRGNACNKLRKDGNQKDC